MYKLWCFWALLVAFMHSGCDFSGTKPDANQVLTGVVQTGTYQTSVKASQSSVTLSSESSGVVALLEDASGTLLDQEILQPVGHEKYPFTFTGKFKDRELFLRVKDGGEYPVFLGKADDSLVPVNLGQIDVQKAALATRYLKNMKSYGELRSKNFEEIQKMRQTIEQNRVESNPKAVEMIQKLDQVGIDEKGDLELKGQKNPENYLDARRPVQMWEKDIAGRAQITTKVSKEESFRRKNMVRSAFLSLDSVEVDLMTTKDVFLPLPLEKSSAKLTLHLLGDLAQPVFEKIIHTAILRVKSLDGLYFADLPMANFQPKLESARQMSLIIERPASNLPQKLWYSLYAEVPSQTEPEILDIRFTLDFQTNQRR